MLKERLLEYSTIIHNEFKILFPDNESLEKKLNVKSYYKTDFNKIIVENDCGITNQKGLVVESCDKSVRVRFTLSEIISQIQDKYRVELYDALFAGKLSLAGGF